MNEYRVHILPITQVLLFTSNTLWQKFKVLYKCFLITHNPAVMKLGQISAKFVKFVETVLRISTKKFLFNVFMGIDSITSLPL